MNGLIELLLIWTVAVPCLVVSAAILRAHWRERIPISSPATAPAVPVLIHCPESRRSPLGFIAWRGPVSARRHRNPALRHAASTFATAGASQLRRRGA